MENVKPPKHVCPEKYCFFWHMDKCDEAYKLHGGNDCIRRPHCQLDANDWYEPCEPELIRDGLPFDYLS